MRSAGTPPLRAIFPPQWVRSSSSVERNWIDAHDAAEFQRTTKPAPIEIQPPQIRVDLNGDPVLATSGKDRLDIQFISRGIGGTKGRVSARHSTLAEIPEVEPWQASDAKR
jgi:hypothetical protein